MTPGRTHNKAVSSRENTGYVGSAETTQTGPCEIDINYTRWQVLVPLKSKAEIGINSGMIYNLVPRFAHNSFDPPILLQVHLVSKRIVSDDIPGAEFDCCDAEPTLSYPALLALNDRT